MILNWTRHSVTCALACAAMLLGSGTLHAEGSRSMFPSGIAGARAPMDLTNNATYAGVARNRQFIYVYAEANEYILVGSRNRGSNGDVFIYNPQSFGTPANETIPGTANFTCSTTNTGPAAFGGGTRGTISSRANELAGPNSANNAVTVTNGWSPCAYRAPSTGIYGVRFTGASSGGLSVQAADTGTLQVLASQVSAWEVAVRANVASTTDLNGRVFTYAWIGRTGGNGVNARVFHSLYYVTQDGYRYEQTMKGLDPFAYALYGNAQGFTDNGDPLYKSVRGDNQTASVIQPAGTGITAQAAQYPIFFSTLSPSAPHAAQINATLTALSIPTTPPVPQLLSASFAGDVGGVVSTQNVGGTFTFETVNTLSYQIVISRDGVNFDPANTLNRVLYGTANTGTHMEVWDGLDNGGLPFPVGSFPFRVSGRNGEVHFPIIDTEGMALGGPRVAQLNGSLSTTVYYDDRGYVTSNGTLVGELNGHICGAGNAQVEPSPRQALAGVDSSTTYRSYPQVTNDPNTDCVSNPATHFGTAKALDTWALERTVDISDTLVVVLADMSATFGAIPPVFSPGQTVTGLTLTCANGGPSDAVNATCVPTVSAGSISGLSCTPSSPAASLANGASMVCTFNFTAPGTAGGTDTAATGITFTGTAGAANDSVTGNNVVTVATTVIDAVNDDFTGAPIGGVAGGVTASVFANDTLGVATVTAGAVTPSITNNGGLTGASINANGTINVPAGSAGGTYAVTYQICTLTPPTPAVCDTAVASVLVIAPRLSMTKTASASPWTVGVPASYTLSVQNTGTQATTAGAAITDSIPAGLSIGALPGGCSAASQVVTCTIASRGQRNGQLCHPGDSHRCGAAERDEQRDGFRRRGPHLSCGRALHQLGGSDHGQCTATDHHQDGQRKPLDGGCGGELRAVGAEHRHDRDDGRGHDQRHDSGWPDHRRAARRLQRGAPSRDLLDWFGPGSQWHRDLRDSGYAHCCGTAQRDEHSHGVGRW